jgi:TetR/AcrR family transcriptional regulator
MTQNDTRQPTRSIRQRILDAASSSFAARGFSGARVDEIARRAGVNKALLYYHVGNKQALYTSVMMRNFDRIETALANVMTSGGSARDRLTAVIATITRTLQRYPDHPRIVLRELASAGGHLEPEVLDRMLRVVDIVRGLLADGVRSGEFRATEPVMTHLTMIGASLILNAVAPLRSRAAALGPEMQIPADDTRVAPFLTDLLLNGIAAPRTGEAT